MLDPRVASRVPRDLPPLRRGNHRQNVAGGGERRSCLALLTFRLLAVQAQQELIQFADSLQSLLEIAIVLDRLANARDLLGPQAHLAGLSTGITHRENPEWMAVAAGALRTARRVMEGPLEQ